MSQAEKDHWSWKGIYDLQSDFLRRSPPKCADLMRTLDRMEAAEDLADAAEGMQSAIEAALADAAGAAGEAGAAAFALPVLGAALGYGASLLPVVGGGSLGDFYGDALYNLCPTCFQIRASAGRRR